MASLLEQPLLHETSQIGDLPEPQLVSRPSFRSRNRPVISWGPPPVAAYNMTQLPFKIDETPSKSTRGPEEILTQQETSTMNEQSSPPLANAKVVDVDDDDESNDTSENDDDDDDDDTDEGLVMTMHNSKNGAENMEETNEL